MEEERWAIWQSNVRYALHQCVATLQCRFQNINANTCLLCPASGQWSLFFFCICSNPLWHNAYTLAEGGADGPTYEALWRFWEIYVWKCHGWNVTYWVCMFHIDFPSSRGKEVCDSDVCAEMSAHWYQIRSEQSSRTRRTEATATCCVLLKPLEFVRELFPAYSPDVVVKVPPLRQRTKKLSLLYNSISGTSAWK